MEVSKPEIPQQSNERHQQFITDNNNCCLCGSPLHFKHHTDFIRQEVKEEAYCVCCQVRTKAQTARLQ